MGYIYMITNKIDGKIYIGQTIRPIQKRLEEHRTKRSNCVLIYRAILKYGWENFEKDYYECPDGDLNKHEELMVEVLGTLTPGGYNLREGGGNRGKMSEETKQKMSESKQGDKNHNYGLALDDKTKKKLSEANNGEKNYWYGKNHTDETKQKLSKALLGKTHTNEAKQKIREARLGKTHTNETKQKMCEAKQGEKNHNSKKVYQYDLKGNFISSFGSCGEAARPLGKKDGTKISACAYGNRKTAYGFKWSYTHLV
jgi:group I intron endonuclease